jgi:hypothetical protein
MPTKQQPNPFFNATGFRRSLNANDHSLENINTLQGRNVRLDNPEQWIGTIDFQKERLGAYKKTDYLSYKSPFSVLIDPLLFPRTSLTDIDYSTATILKDKYEHARILELVARNHKDIEKKHEIHFQFKNIRRPSALNLDWLFSFCESGGGHIETLRIIDDAGHWSSMGSGKDYFDFHDGEYAAGYKEIKKINNGNASLFNVKIHSVNNIVDYRPINGFTNPLADFPTNPINGDAFVASQSEIISPIISILNEPPVGFSAGDRHLVDNGALGVWQNHVGQIATAMDSNNWVFEDSEDGQMVLKTSETVSFYQSSAGISENILQKDSAFQIRTNLNEEWDDLFALYLTFAESTTVKKITLYLENITINATYGWRLTKNTDPNTVIASGTIQLINSEENARHCFPINRHLCGEYTLFIDMTKTEGQGEGCVFEYAKSTTSGLSCGVRDAATKVWTSLPDIEYPNSGIVFTLDTIEWGSVSNPFLGELEEIPSTGRINGNFPTEGDIIFSQKRRSYFIAEAGWGLIDFVQVDPQEDNYWTDNKIFNFVKIINYNPTTGDASGLYYCVGETDDAYKGKFVKIVQGSSRTEYAVPEDALLIVSATCSEENYPVGVYYHKGRRTAPLNPIQPNGLEYETIVYSFSESMIFCGSYGGEQDPNTYTANENVFIQDSENTYYLRYLWRPLWIKDFVYCYRHGQWHVLFPDRPGGMIKGVDFIISNASNIHQFRPVLAQIDGDSYIIPDNSEYNHRQPVKASLFKTGVYDTSQKIGFKYLDLSSYDNSLDIVADSDIWDDLWKGPLFENPFSWTAVHFVVKNIGDLGFGNDGRYLEADYGMGDPNYLYFFERQGSDITRLPYLTRPGLTTIIVERNGSFNHNCEFTFGSTYDSGEPIDTIFGYASKEFRWRKTAVYIDGIESDLNTIDYSKYTNGDRFLITTDVGNKYYRVYDNNYYEETQEFDSNNYYIVQKTRNFALYGGRNESYKYFVDYNLLFFSMAEMKNISIDKRQIYGYVVLRDPMDFMNQVLNLIIMIFTGAVGFGSTVRDKRWVSALNPASWGRQIRRFSLGAITKPDGSQKYSSIAFDWLLMSGDPNSHRLLERLGQSGSVYARSLMVQNFFGMSQTSFAQSTLTSNSFTQSAKISSGFSKVAPLLNNMIIFNPNDEEDENLDRVKDLSGMEPLITMLIPIESANNPIEVMDNEYLFEKGYVYLPKIPGFGQNPIFEKAPVMPGMFGFSLGKPVMYNGEIWDENFFLTAQNIQNMPLLTLFNSTVILSRYDPSQDLPENPQDWQIFCATENGNGWEAGQVYIYFPSNYHSLFESLENGYMQIEFAVGTRIYDLSGKSVFVQKDAGWQLEEFYNVIDILPEPPASPTDGDRYLVSHSPTIGEAWAELANNIAIYNLDEDAWMPIPLLSIPEGMELYVQEKGCRIRKVGGKWVDFIGHQGSSAPESPSQGQLYWDTDDETWYRWSGSAWIQVSGSGQAVGGSGTVFVLGNQDTPPSTPSDGDAYIIMPTGTGDWAAHDNEIASWDSGVSQWVFIPTSQILKGTSAFVDDDAAIINWTGAAWKTHKHGGVFAPVLDILYTPPVDPSAGDRYLVDRSPEASTAWEDKGNQIAEWNGVSWELSMPADGNSVVVESEKSEAVYDGSNWLISNINRKSGWPMIPITSGEVCIWIELGVSISIDTTSGAIFKITCSNPAFPIYWNGYKIFRFGDENDQIDLEEKVSASGFYQIYYDSSAGPEDISLLISQGYDMGAPPGGFVHVATIYVNMIQSPTKYLISYDPHSLYLNLRQHAIDHWSNGLLRMSGYSIESVSESEIELNNGAWLDEDICYLFGKSIMLIPVIYRDSLVDGIPTWDYDLNPNGSYYLFEPPVGQNPAYIKFDNEGVLTDAEVGFCVNIWLILTSVKYDGDTSASIDGDGVFAIIGQRQFASLNDALTERFDELALGNSTDNFITNEFVPLHRITLRSTASGIVLEHVQKLFDEPFEKISVKSLEDVKYVNAQWDPNLSASGSYSGNTAPLYVGESVVFGDGLYLDASTKTWKKLDASAAAAAKLPGLAIALESKEPEEPDEKCLCLCLMNGFIRNENWSFTVGDAVYASAATVGALSTTPPSTSGHFIQVVGQANDTDILYLHPEITVREV